MEPLIKPSTKEMVFAITPDVPASFTVELESISELPVLFKLKLSKMERYSVNPPAGVVPPGQKIAVVIRMTAYSQIPPDVFSCRDRFRLETAPMPRTESADIAELWQEVPPKTTRFQLFPVKMVIGDDSRWKEIADKMEAEANLDKGRSTTTPSETSASVKSTTYSGEELLRRRRRMADEIEREISERSVQINDLKRKIELSASNQGLFFLSTPILFCSSTRVSSLNAFLLSRCCRFQ
uniref:MSP domain-containing protein n=3 Tax=Rhodosorus marinus TaxID=101924 RepID=A0A7S3A1J7_9RHOD|mmetsp:Transcript_37493/g.149562  ORF Transcript_37493/g.149562 Transcript_37493/m.149562 type:complete len:238 (+) Transcript_37493:167-880(+)